MTASRREFLRSVVALAFVPARAITPLDLDSNSELKLWAHQFPGCTVWRNYSCKNERGSTEGLYEFARKRGIL
jgi:hypothetical protein